MATWKHSLFLECTFFQDKAMHLCSERHAHTHTLRYSSQGTKSVDPKPMSLALKVANGRNSKKAQTVGNATLDLVRAIDRRGRVSSLVARG